MCGCDQLLELCLGQRRVRIESHRFERIFDLRQLRFDTGHRLPEQTEPLEQSYDIGADPGGRTEVDDVDGNAAPDAIQPPDALLHCRRCPRQVVEHQPPAELEVASLATGFGRHQQARPIVGAKPRDLRVAPCRRQVLVEDATGQLRARTEGVAQHLQRLAMGNEHERLLVGPTPLRRLLEQPRESWIGPVHRLGLLS